MIYNIIPFILIIISVAVIIMIVVRKFPQVSSIDVDTIQEEKDSEIKKQIVQRRLKRVYDEKKKNISKLAGPVVNKMKDKGSSVYKKIQSKYHELEKKDEIDRELPELDLSEAEKLIHVAWSAFEKGAIQEAEDKFIKAISLDDKLPAAYEGLANVYIKNKDFKKSKETLKYTLKLTKSLKRSKKATINDGDISRLHYLFSKVSENENNLKEALSHIKSAHQFDSKNPRYVDKLVDLSIKLKDSSMARDYLLKLKLVNPDNKKITEFEDRIDAMNKK